MAAHLCKSSHLGGVPFHNYYLGILSQSQNCIQGRLLGLLALGSLYKASPATLKHLLNIIYGPLEVRGQQAKIQVRANAGGLFRPPTIKAVLDQTCPLPRTLA